MICSLMLLSIVHVHGSAEPPAPETTGQVSTPSQNSPSATPHIILIYADDLGYGDLACYGHPYAKTPNLDKLASEGTLFKRFYVTGTTCHPSRCGILTSRMPASYPLPTVTYGFDQAQFGHVDRPTIMQLLKEEAGYTTGLVGKWHLGDKAPEAAGTYALDEVTIKGGGFKAPRGRDEDIFRLAIDFVERNHQKGPFYLNVMARITHHPVDPRPDLVGKAGFTDLKVSRADFKGQQIQHVFDLVESAEVGDRSIDTSMANYLTDVFFLDQFVGELVAKIDELGIGDNTIILFSSDQGPAYMGQGGGPKGDLFTNLVGYSGGLRGQKHTEYEGGVRSLCIMRWPGQVPAGKINTDSVWSGLDWLPTLCAIAGVDMDPAEFHGENVLSIWKGADHSRSRPMFWRRSMQKDEWRLYFDKGNPVELYDLSTDTGETQNLLAEKPEVVAELIRLWKEWSAALPEK